MHAFHTSLAVHDLVVEYTTGPFVSRPIDRLSFAARPGTLTLLHGPSGCGKTTLLSCLGALLPAQSGSIVVGGTEVVGLAGAALAAYRRHRVGIVFQAFNLVGSLDLVENVMVPQRAAGASTNRLRTSTTSRSRACCSCCGRLPTKAACWWWRPTTIGCCRSQIRCWTCTETASSTRVTPLASWFGHENGRSDGGAPAAALALRDVQ